jgi:hypothetical protein
VQRLVEARLLVADRREDLDVVEVAHESLLRQRAPLTLWLQAESDDLSLAAGVERAAAEWAPATLGAGIGSIIPVVGWTTQNAPILAVT